MIEEVVVERLAYGGDGVAKLPSGKVVFVPNACPGDKLQIEIVSQTQRYDRAQIKYILEPSQFRNHTKYCKHCDVCGGCPWQFLDYEAQLAWKRTFVVDALQRIGKIENAEELVGNCIPSPKQLGYRNKIELVPTMDEGKLRLGYHVANSDIIVPIDSCPLFAAGHERVPKALAGALGYLKAMDYGLYRVGIRASTITNSQQIALWTTTGHFPRKAAVDIITSAVSCTSITRVMQKEGNQGKRPDSTEILFGADVWRERLNGITMRVSAPSFFQVNTLAAERLVDVVINQLDIQPTDTCCDLYCGTGTFTLPMAQRSSLVYAIESTSSSIRDLRRNLEENDLDAIVVGGDAGRESRDFGRVDVLLMDPPYSGIASNVYESVIGMSPERIALVSCNPTTLARDTIGLTSLGYEVRSVTPVDLFPQTYHIETVTILDKGLDYKAKAHAYITRKAEQAKAHAQRQSAAHGGAGRPHGNAGQGGGTNRGGHDNRDNRSAYHANLRRRRSNKYSGKYGRGI